MELEKEHTDLIEKLVKLNPKYSGNEDLLEDFCSEAYQKSYLILQSVEDINSLEAYMRKVVSSAIIDVLKNSGRIVRATKGYSSVKEITISPENNKEEVKAISDFADGHEQNIREEEKNVLTIDTELQVDNPDNDFELADEMLSFSEDENTIADVEKEDILLDIEPESNEKLLYGNIPQRVSLNLEEVKDPRESIEEQIIRKDILENIIKMVIQINEENPSEMFLKIFYSRYFLQKKQREIAQETGLSQSEVSKRLVQLSRLIKEKLY